MQGLAETGKGLRIEQELSIRDALGLKAPHEIEATPAVELTCFRVIGLPFVHDCLVFIFHAWLTGHQAIYSSEIRRPACADPECYARSLEHHRRGA